MGGVIDVAALLKRIEALEMQVATLMAERHSHPVPYVPPWFPTFPSPGYPPNTVWCAAGR